MQVIQFCQFARAHQVHPVSALQTEYSLWSRDVETDILPAIQRLDIGFVACSSLGRGFLTGAIRSRNDLEPGDWRLENPRFTEEAIVGNSRLADIVAESAKEIGTTAAPIALAWVLSRESPSPRYRGHGESNAWRKTGRHWI